MPLTRRKVIKTGLSSSVLFLTPSFFSACSTAQEKRSDQLSPLPTSQQRGPASVDPLVRYEVNSPEAAEHVKIYEKAVGIFKANQEAFETAVKNKTTVNIPRGLRWDQQASIHLNHCPHGKWNFFPWHREYIFRFEEKN